MEHKEEIRKAVRERYGAVVTKNQNCCGGSSASSDLVALQLGYPEDALAQAPAEANLGLGCGNPTAIAGLKPGETMLDLGSGAGFDCFLAAQQVGNTGFIIGVDMTPEMISKARENAEKTASTNVEFRLGEIEHLPVADASVDVIISNCVINLSPDKPQVFKEAYRVLKPGGRVAVSDIVTKAELPEAIRNDMSLYTSCAAGASSIEEVYIMLKEAGFTDIRVSPKETSGEFIRDWGENLERYIVSASIEAVKA